jgi:hypothetical protein
MAENGRRSSNTQMAELNAALMAQNNTLTNAAKVAEESLNTTNAVKGELYRQRGVIEGNIEKVARGLVRTRKSRTNSGRPTRKPTK